jgi:hypothetical protein
MRKQAQETESLSPCALNNVQNIYKQIKRTPKNFKTNFMPFKTVILIIYYSDYFII